MFSRHEHNCELGGKPGVEVPTGIPENGNGDGALDHQPHSLRDGHPGGPPRRPGPLVEADYTDDDVDGQLPPFPPVDAWPNKPVYACLSRSLPRSAQRRLDGLPHFECLPINNLHSIPFSTDLFEGCLLLNVAHVDPHPPAHQPRGGFLNGCREGRTIESAILGRFKRRLRFDEVYTGQLFRKPFKRLPAHWMVKAVQMVVRRLAPAIKLDVTSQTPFLMGPLAAVACVMQVTDPRQGPSKGILHMSEDTALLGGVFSGGEPLDRLARKKHFSNNDHLTQHYFEPELEYGFGFFGGTWRAFEGKLDVGGLAKIDMAYYLAEGCTAQVMARLKDQDEYLWAVDIWHSRFLSPQQVGGDEQHHSTPHTDGKVQLPSSAAVPAWSDGDLPPRPRTAPPGPVAREAQASNGDNAPFTPEPSHHRGWFEDGES